MKKYFLFALLTMFLVGCDSPNVNNPSGGDSDDDGGGSNKSYVVTGEAKDVTYKSVTLYGEVNVEIADYETIEWGMMYSTDKDELEDRNGVIVACDDALIENAYRVELSNLVSETKYYYCAYVNLNNKQYRFGETNEFTTLENPKIDGIGTFSVSDSKQVTFSQGNLQYTQSTNTWSFARAQWEVIGTDNVIGGNVSSDENGDRKEGTALADKVDLFGWSTNDTHFGVSTSVGSGDYSGSFVDWGTNKIGSDAPNTWRTLASYEWGYLLNYRPNARSLKGVAQVNGVNGLILLPDNWTCPSGVTFKSGFHSSYGTEYYAAYQTFTAAEWSKLESAGAVFLPASGYRCYGSYVRNVQDRGYYWSATVNDSYDAACLYFSEIGARMNFSGRFYGQSVRLVKDL
jgi:hypothetical protein